MIPKVKLKVNNLFLNLTKEFWCLKLAKQQVSVNLVLERLSERMIWLLHMDLKGYLVLGEEHVLSSNFF